jgi:hypothetical protein
MNDTYSDTSEYNSISETVHQQHTGPSPLYKTEPVPQHTHNIRTAHLIGNKHTKSKYTH